MIYAGRSGMERRPGDGRPDMVETMRGDAMSSFLREALWGFGNEAYSLPGTMRLSMYRKMDRYGELFFSENQSSVEQEEFKSLKEEMRLAGLDNVAKDETYQEFSRQMRLKYPELNGNKPMVSKQNLLLAEKTAEVLAQIMVEDRLASSFGR
jgi:hypothetical protein